MKAFAAKYLTVLAILGFGFLGGYLFVKPQVNECEEQAQKLFDERNECRDKFVQCIMYLMQQEGAKKK